MKCPFCNSLDTSVKNSRSSENSMCVRRRRVCMKCNSRFTTMEELLLKPVRVVKKDGSVEPFDRQKLLASVLVAVRKRPVNQEQINTVVGSILYELEAIRGGEVSSVVIGKMVMDKLSTLDKISYIRFASVYMNFSDAEDFCGIVEKIREVV